MIVMMMHWTCSQCTLLNGNKKMGFSFYQIGVAWKTWKKCKWIQVHQVQVLPEPIHHERLKNCSLQFAIIQMSSYTGHTILILGEILEPAKDEWRLPLVVVKGNKPPLLGIDWPQKIKLNRGKDLQFSKRQKRYTAHTGKLCLKKHKDLFKDGYGKIKDFRAEIKSAEWSQANLPQATTSTLCSAGSSGRSGRSAWAPTDKLESSHKWKGVTVVVEPKKDKASEIVRWLQSHGKSMHIPRRISSSKCWSKWASIWVNRVIILTLTLWEKNCFL